MEPFRGPPGAQRIGIHRELAPQPAPGAVGATCRPGAPEGACYPRPDMSSARGQAQGILPLLPLRSMVLFPGVAYPVELGRAASVAAVHEARRRREGRRPPRVILGTQRDPMVEHPRAEDLLPVGVLAEVLQILDGMPGRATAIVRGVHRVHLLDLIPAAEHVDARFQRAHDKMGDPTLTYALAGAVQDLLRQHDELLPKNARSRRREQTLANLVAERSPGAVADLAAAHLDLKPEERFELLTELGVGDRLRRLMELASHRINVLRVKRDLDRHVREHMSRHEQRAMLRHKLRAIQSELGEEDDTERRLRELHERLLKRELPPAAREAARKNLSRLARMNPQSNEAGVTRRYLEWIADLPWGPSDATTDRNDLQRAREILETGHHGMDRVKRRIVEFLGVRSLAPNLRGPILCLAGPPGVGKTSLSRSIARALGRRFVSISLGGVRDDAEIRGHRRTYVGSLPGRILHAMKRAGTTNPVILLDEIDKLVAPDLRGDPASALLEVLDPEQNDAFEDHYLEVPYDLSRVIFIATANDPGRIPGVLRDRLELIELSGYTLADKIAIARDHLWPRARADHGLGDTDLAISEPLIQMMAEEYTRESGVRNLQRCLESVLRDVAMTVADGGPLPAELTEDDVRRILGPPRVHPEHGAEEAAVGLVAGLGWTASGGRLLFVEALVNRGEGNLRLTGRLGEVMTESGQAALSLVRSKAAEFGVDPNFFRRHDVHIHLPHGAVPKDGPSAGVTVTTALVSALTGRPVRADLAMTGEVTLRGKVLPVGGIREKLVTAHRAGLTHVILPEGNRKDIPDLPAQVRDELTLHFVRDIHQVLRLALLDPAERAA